MRRVLLLLIALPCLALAAFVAWTSWTPWFLGWEGESPLGFYRLELVEYEIVDYGGNGTVWVGRRFGGPLELIGYLAVGRELQPR